MEEFIFKEAIQKEVLVEVLEALHRDQTGLAVALQRVKGIANSWRWATESRGSYEWDEDRYMQEFGACLDNITQYIDLILSKSSKAHQICCGKYGHIHSLPNEPIQICLDFGFPEYPDFKAEITKFCTLEGRPE